jgi:small subunit ribosomal protein S21
MRKDKNKFTGFKVEVFDNNIEKAIKILKKKVLADGLLKELKARTAFEKPSDKKRREKKESLRKAYKNKVKENNLQF